MREQTFSGLWLEVWILTILVQKAAFCGTEYSRFNDAKMHHEQTSKK